MRSLRNLALGLSFVALYNWPGGMAWSADGAATGPSADAVPDASGGYTTIFRFKGGPNGNWPRGGVALDADRNIYGMLLYGGLCSTCGAIYKLTKPVGGKKTWDFNILHKFDGNKQDGIGPTGPLSLKGNTLYGTTAAGADFSCGCGEVFKIGTSGAGYQILHRFNRTQGTTPVGGVLVGDDGTLYGTTSGGGPQGAGVIYKIGSGGGFSVLHNFVGNSGSGPQGEMIFGKDGAIYGTSFGNGKYNRGFVFRITKGGGYSVLYDFLGVDQPGGSHDGAEPEGRIALGDDGTLYGTTTFGGTPSGYGTAWSLSPPKTGGRWGYKQIYIFGKRPALPNLPHNGLVIDKSGHLYGAGSGGGVHGGGVLYKLTAPKSGANWDLTKLHDFTPRDPGGDIPYADLVLKLGTLYGSTLVGGTLNGNCRDGCGVVFQHKL